jgi:AMIN domain-containing protein
MRVLTVGGVIFLASLLLPGALLVAQNPAYVDHLSVRDGGAAIEVEIHTTGKVPSPNTQAITGPDRIVVDFPGALPGEGLGALKVNRGPLKAVRSGLFFKNPPITRVVFDLTGAQTYQISQIADGFIVRLGSASPNLSAHATPSEAPAPRIGGARLTTVARITDAPVYESATNTTPRGQAAPPAPPAIVPVVEPPKPAVSVSFQNGMLSIRTDRATLAEVLFEVQKQTKAEIAIPAGAEQEQVVTDIGPAPPRDVLASLLNGSSYNFIFVGNEQDGSLGKVILSRRQPDF